MWKRHLGVVIGLVGVVGLSACPTPKNIPRCSIPRECQPIDSSWPESVQAIELDEEWTVYYTRLAFLVIKPTLPPDIQSAAERDFNSAIATVDDLNDAFRQVAMTTTDVHSQNYLKALTDIEAAVQNIVAIVERYHTAAPATARATAPTTAPAAAPAGDADKNLAEARRASSSMKARVAAATSR